MFLHAMDRWLGEVSGGLGPIFRWVWAALVAVSTGGLVYLVAAAWE